MMHSTNICWHCQTPNITKNCDTHSTGWWCDTCQTLNLYDKTNQPKFRTFVEDNAQQNSRIIQTPTKKLSKRMSLLRYPGGKTKLIDFIATQIRPSYKNTLISPFVGGGSVEFALLDAQIIDHLIINDKDYALYTFYNQLFTNPTPLIDLITNTPITRDLALIAKKQIINKHYSIPSEQLAFYYLLNNRLSFSGIYNANLMGGKTGTIQQLTQRYNPDALIKRILKLHKLRNKITLTNQDAISFLDTYYWEPNSTLYLDPPYIKASHVTLYQHAYTYPQHYELIATLNNLWLEFPNPDILLFYDKALLDLNIDLYDQLDIIQRYFSIANK